MQLLIKYGNIVLTTTTGHRVRYHLWLLLLVWVGGYIVNLLDFYSYRLIGKLTAFLQIQEFSLPNKPQCPVPLPPRGFLSTVQEQSWLTLAKTSPVRINLNLDGASIASNSHTHPSHSQTSRLLVNPTVMVIQQWSKQSFHPHHPGGVPTPPLGFLFLFTILLGKC